MGVQIASRSAAGMVMSAAWTERTAPDGSSSVDPFGVTIVVSATRPVRRTSHTARAPAAVAPTTIGTTAITDMGGASHAGTAPCAARPAHGFPARCGFSGPSPSDPTGMIGAMAEPPALDAPVAGLGDADALARRGLLEWIAARPRGEAARLPTERMGSEGPALVAAVVGALVSDRELERLTPEGDLGGVAAAAGAIAGAREPPGGVGGPGGGPGRRGGG